MTVARTHRFFPRPALSPRRGPCVALAVGTLITLTGCSSSPDAGPTAPAASSAGSALASSPTMSPAASPRPDRAPRVRELLGPGTAIVTAQARPSTTTQDGRSVAMIIRDENRSTWAAGRYKLTVACVGDAQLVVSFDIGGHAVSAVFPPCTEAGISASLTLESPAAAQVATVIIAPAGESDAEIGYAIRKG